jgi:hypothetical protein
VTLVLSNLVSVYLEPVLVSMLDRCMITKLTIGSVIILEHLMVLQGEEAQVEAYFVHLEIVLILMQDRCIVFRRMYYRLKNRFGQHDGTPT